MATTHHPVSHSTTYRYRDAGKRRWYMKMYMAAKRAVAKGLADWWPRKANG